MGENSNNLTLPFESARCPKLPFSQSILHRYKHSRGQNERQNATAFKKAIKRPWRPSVPRVLLIFRSNLKCLLAQQASV